MKKACRFIPFGLCVLLACDAPLLSEEKSPSAASVVWIVCEDQSLFFAQYGDSTAHTPNLNALAQDGTVFNHMFSVSPVCAPSRSSIITGLLPTTTGTHHMRAYRKNGPGNNPQNGLPFYSAKSPSASRAFTEYLRMQGVYCSNNSKEDYNFRTPPLSWDNSSKNGHWRNRPKNAKFFSVFNIFATHESNVWRQKNLDCSLEWSDIPSSDLLPNTPSVQRDQRNNYCNIERMDGHVGRILNELKEDGLYDSSMIVFFSDHGGPFPLYKRELSDAGLHVPCIIKWPKGVHAPAFNDGLFSFLDLAPTVLRWLQVNCPTGLPGLAISPYHPGHEAIFGASDRMDEQKDMRRTIRTKDWRLTRNLFPMHKEQLQFRQAMASTTAIDSAAQARVEPWFSWRTKARPTWQLYDIADNPHQPIENALLSEHQEILDRLKPLLDSVFNPKTDLGFLDEAEMVHSFGPEGIPDTLAAPTLSRIGNQFSLSHPDSNVSLGFRPVNSRLGYWKITTRNEPLDLSFKIDSIEVIAARIGWEDGRQTIPLQDD